MSIFHFKQFSIQQANSAMKVGTDSIILASWLALTDEESILDIGTGTGVLALMLAQRSDAEIIDAVEIEPVSFEEAVGNFENSPWADRLFCYHTSIQKFAEEIEDTYDLIISNPPYFESSQLSENHNRKIARQTSDLNHTDLLKATSNLLSEKASAAFVIPYELEKQFTKLASDVGLFPFRKLYTKDTETAKYKRCFLHFKNHQTTCETSALVLKNADKSYSDEFGALTKEFYRDF